MIGNQGDPVHEIHNHKREKGKNEKGKRKKTLELFSENSENLGISIPNMIISSNDFTIFIP